LSDRFSQITIPAKGVRSLCFHGDELVDWAGGARVFTMDGVDHGRRLNLGYRFDAAIASPDGKFTVVYERLGTKALLLDRGKLVRELDRSYYCADAYEYPIHLFRLPDGRDVLVHCPEEYNRIEIDEVGTGRRLTDNEHRKPGDFFHSRFASNPSGTLMLSAGWVWHPWDAVLYFDVRAALAEPTLLDAVTGHAPTSFIVDLVEESSACWLTDDTVAIGGSADAEDPGTAAEYAGVVRPMPSGLAVFDATARQYTRTLRLKEPVGTMMRLDESHVVSFHGYPKVLSVVTGEVIHAWPELRTGTQTSSICRGLSEPIPPMAMEPVGRRFAVAREDAIVVVTMGAIPGE
jgi:hypothetical protein